MKSTDAVQAGLVLACGGVMVAAGRSLLAAPQGPPGMDRTVGVVLSALGVGTVGLWVLAFVAAVLAELLERRGASSAAALARRCTPAVLRRIAAALLGVHLLAVPAAGQAAPHGSPAGSVAPVAGAAAADGTDVPRAGEGAAVDPGVQVPPGSPSWSPTTVLERAADGSGRRVPSTAPSGTVEPTGTPDPAGPAAAPAARASPGSAEPPSPPVSVAAPVSPAWEPTPMPVDGGLLVRPETRPTAGRTEVVVAPGDSLWSIVAARLGPLATAAEVAESWPAWYEANRAVIGQDPSLLIPGQVLAAPLR
ncbi:LysM peptidoglycan-binding domain-containing protein [Arthrobacter sp. MDT1-65]